MRFVFLSSTFYQTYSDCHEILLKDHRPYVLALIVVKQITYAIPLRSNIRHEYAYFTDKANHCGIDYSKAVVITDAITQLDDSRSPHIRQNEFDALRGKDYLIQKGMQKYVQVYKRALREKQIQANQALLEKSTLQYFHTEIGID